VVRSWPASACWSPPFQFAWWRAWTSSADWTVKESVRAKLRTIVKRILRKHGYPPDKQESATATVLEQAELLGLEWAA
jgi:hypothetical protein